MAGRRVPQAWAEEKGSVEFSGGRAGAGGRAPPAGLSRSATLGGGRGAGMGSGSGGGGSAGGAGSRDGVNYSKTMSGEGYREKGFDASTRCGQLGLPSYPPFSPALCTEAGHV
jgi:hypothetical protein